MDAIIGHTGFVGSNIIEKMKFDFMYNSKNINEISNHEYDLVICSGIPSLKWYANKHPKEDLENINKLLGNLVSVKCNKFILISTIDIYKIGFNNPKFIKCDKNHFPYGYNRYLAEIELQKIYGDRLVIIRIPALFGNHLKKNILYDLINNDLYKPLNLCDTYQWYDVRDLTNDINFILKNQILEINLLSEPIRIKEIVDEFFQIDLINSFYDCNSAEKYDLGVNYNSMNYWNTKDEIMNKLKNFLT